MQKNRLFILSIGILILMLYGIYAFGQVQNPGHTWSQIDCNGTMCVDETNHIITLGTESTDPSKVGIGTTSPTQKLEVLGNIVGSNLSTSGSVTGGIFYDNSNGAYYVDLAGTTSAILNGNVGIGTTSPNQKLDVSGYIKASTGFCIDTNCITSWPSGGGGLSGSGTTNYISKWTETSSLGNSLIYDNGTNVGIGTTSPSQKLHVSGNILGSNLSTSGSVTGAIFYDNNNTAYYVDPAGTTSAILNGNVGIGTTSPVHKLGVRSVIQAFTDDNKFLTIYGGSDVRTIIFDDSDTLQFGTWNARSGGGYSTKMTLTNGGNLGVGGSITAQIFYDSNNTNYYANPADLSYFNNFQTAGHINSGGQVASYAFQTGGMRLSRNGNNARISVAESPYTNDLEIYVGGADGSSDVIVRNSSGSDSARLHVNTLYATYKQFLIDHPTKNGMKLAHSAIEGPEAAVYYRGEAQLRSGKAVVKLPDYFEALTRKEGRTVLLTCIDGWTPLYVKGGVKNGMFIVESPIKNVNQKFYWEVKAVRADIQPLEVERDASEIF